MRKLRGMCGLESTERCSFLLQSRDDGQGVGIHAVTHYARGVASQIAVVTIQLTPTLSGIPAILRS